MPTKQQVLAEIGADCSYEDAARRLGIPVGQAYMVATGLPADGGDSFPSEELARPGVIAGSTQHLVYPAMEARNPTQDSMVHEWIRQRARCDGPMVRAARSREE